MVPWKSRRTSPLRVASPMDDTSSSRCACIVSERILVHSGAIVPQDSCSSDRNLCYPSLKNSGTVEACGIYYVQTCEVKQHKVPRSRAHTLTAAFTRAVTSVFTNHQDCSFGRITAVMEPSCEVPSPALFRSETHRSTHRADVSC